MNYYTELTANSLLPCSQENYEELEKELSGMMLDSDGFELWHDIQIELDKEEEGLTRLHLYSDQSGDIDNLPPTFLKLLGMTIARAGLPYWEIGCSWTADRKVPASQGGTTYRIHTDGTVEEAHSWWTGALKHYLVIGRIPGFDEDSDAHVAVDDDHDPVEMFIRHVLYGGDQDLPEQIIDDQGFVMKMPGYDEPWATSIRLFELLGPPVDGPCETYVFQKGCRTWE